MDGMMESGDEQEAQDNPQEESMIGESLGEMNLPAGTLGKVKEGAEIQGTWMGTVKAANQDGSGVISLTNATAEANQADAAMEDLMGQGGEGGGFAQQSEGGMAS